MCKKHANVSMHDMLGVLLEIGCVFSSPVRDNSGDTVVIVAEGDLCVGGCTESNHIRHFSVGNFACLHVVLFYEDLTIQTTDTM